MGAVPTESEAEAEAFVEKVREALVTAKQDEETLIALKDKVITAVNGGVAANKLLQIAAGSIYDNEESLEYFDRFIASDR